MFEKLRKLENPNHPLLGPTLLGLKLWGLWQSESKLTRILYNLIHLCATLFVLTQYIELWIIRSQLEPALRNLSFSLLSTVCIFKAVMFVVWQKDWRSVMDNVSTLERHQLSLNDMTTNRIIKKYTKYSRLVTYFYWCLVMMTVFTVTLAPLAMVISSGDMESIRNGSATYPEIISSWVPFDKTKGYGYCILLLEHSLICFYGGGVVANFDSNAVVLMSFFTGQLYLLKINCARLFGDKFDKMDFKKATKKIRACHLHHLYLVKNAKMLNSVLSPVMFLYVIICSLMICASAAQLTTESTTSMQKIYIAEFLIALIAQLFLYCWHSTKVYYMSLKVDDGVYASAWWSQEVRVRRSVALLAAQLRRKIVFTAGPYTKLTVSTFVAIMKGSYSYFTLLSQKEN